MCSNDTPPPSGSAPLPLVPYVKPMLSDPGPPPLDQYRLQLYNYALRAQMPQQYLQMYLPLPGYSPLQYHPRLALYQRLLQPEEPKPQHSYIGLIAMAILSSSDTKLVLSDIYQYILDNYPYFRTRGPGWRNSIRHNLSLNDCFIKAGRSANGKGHYWAIHPANVDDFKKGDFRRRKAQRKVRRHMGLAVDDDGHDSPSPPPVTPPPSLWPPQVAPLVFPTFPTAIPRKRPFDVASLLAPDEGPAKRLGLTPCSSDEEDIDVVTPPGLPGPAHQLLARYYEQLHQARRLQVLHSPPAEDTS